MRSWWKRVGGCSRGATLPEYVLLCSLIAVALIPALSRVRGSSENVFGRLTFSENSPSNTLVSVQPSGEDSGTHPLQGANDLAFSDLGGGTLTNTTGGTAAAAGCGDPNGCP